MIHDQLIDGSLMMTNHGEFSTATAGGYEIQVRHKDSPQGLMVNKHHPKLLVLVHVWAGNTCCVVHDDLYKLGFVWLGYELWPSVFGDVLTILREDCDIWPGVSASGRRWIPFFKIRTCFGVSDSGFLYYEWFVPTKQIICKNVPSWWLWIQSSGCKLSWTVRHWKRKDQGCDADCWVCVHYFTSLWVLPLSLSGGISWARLSLPSNTPDVSKYWNQGLPTQRCGKQWQT